MKTKLFLITMIICAVASSTFAQDSISKKGIHIGSFNLTEATITAGKGAVTSGFDTRVDFANTKGWVIFIQANNDRGVVNVGKKLSKNFTILQSVGQFKNCPWTGVMVLYKVASFDFIAWNGLAFAKTSEIKEFGPNPQFFISYEGVGLTLFKNHRVGGSILWFGNQPMNWFVSYKGTIPIGKQSKIFGEVTYNRNLNIPMFVVGYSFKFTN